MQAIEIEYPEAWTAGSGSSAEAFAQETRMAAAVKLFEIGCLTSGHAAHLAGISRVTFLLSYPQWGVYAVKPLSSAWLASKA